MTSRAQPPTPPAVLTAAEPDALDQAITDFETRKLEQTHHVSCTTEAVPKRTEDWALVNCPTCLRSKNNPTSAGDS